MSAWLLALPGRVWAWAAVVAGAIAGALVLYGRIYSSGRAAQAAEQARQDREATNVRMQEDARADRTTDPAGELRRRWGR